jgi:hypothetical protein
VTNLDLPLLFNHVQEVTVVHYPFEYRAKCEPVMPAECCRESKNWDGVLRWTMMGVNLWALDFRVKEGQYATVSEQEVRYNDAETKYIDKHTTGPQHDGLRRLLWP